MICDRNLDIAVTGWSGRFPGSPSIAALWTALKTGRPLTQRRSREELLADGVPEAVVADPDHVPVAGFLEDADRFDHAFFRISSREAELMDPQYRLMLEAAWRALEDAGRTHPASSLRTGVFASVSGSPYLRALLVSGKLDEATLEQALHGSEPDFVASLIAYKLDLTGPAIGVQTACSSSLVAIHLAIQALLNGDCRQALVVAGGIGFPQAGHLHVPEGIKSSTGCCRPFDAQADGVVEGAGVACVVLRLMADLQSDDPEPYGLLLGSAINNDGASKVGYYAPSPEGQRDVIERALEVAGVPGSAIGYLETHGTGTRLGDPIEWSAASEAYRAAGAAPGQICVGALKGSIGHLDAASGLASLIKALLVVRTGHVPPVPGFQRLNPLLEDATSPLRPPDGHRWTGPHPRRAGVSAFGIGGTNAHLVVGSPPERRRDPPTSDTPHLVALSAADPHTLIQLAQDMAEALRKENVPLRDVAYTLAAGRADLPARLAVCARTSTAAADSLARASLQDYSRPNRPLILMFPGQGAQRPGMAIPFCCLPGFKTAVETVLEAFSSKECNNNVRRALFDTDAPEDLLMSTAVAQPALFALSYAAAKSLQTAGLRPHAMIGHSLGEVAAAVVAGVLPLTDAAEFVVRRGKAMQACPDGAMVSVALSERDAAALGSSVGGLSVAATNGTSATVLAGSTSAVDRLVTKAPESVRIRKLRSSRAFHSPLLAAASSPLQTAAALLCLQPATATWIRTGGAAPIQAGQSPSTDYFWRQALDPVRFVDALNWIQAQMPDALLLDIGPGGALAGLAQAADLDGRALALGDSEESVLEAVGTLWASGQPVDLTAFAPDGHRLHLPTYPFRGPRLLAPELAPVPSIHMRQAPSESEKCKTTPAHMQTAEAILQSLWCELLQAGEVSNDSNFFDLGGDSLLLINLANRLRRENGITVNARDMLAAGTFAKQLELVRSASRGEGTSSHPPAPTIKSTLPSTVGEPQSLNSE
jgi:phthiocerol/phenolphthiocerol synthesis type-I polyketide synthase E